MIAHPRVRGRKGMLHLNHSRKQTGDRQNSELNVDGAWWRQSGRQEYLDIDTLRPIIMVCR